MTRYYVRPVEGEDFLVLYTDVSDAQLGWGPREIFLDMGVSPDILDRAEEWGVCTAMGNGPATLVGPNGRLDVAPMVCGDGMERTGSVLLSDLRALCASFNMRDGRFYPDPALVEWDGEPHPVVGPMAGPPTEPCAEWLERDVVHLGGLGWDWYRKRLAEDVLARGFWQRVLSLREPGQGHSGWRRISRTMAWAAVARRASMLWVFVLGPS